MNYSLIIVSGILLSSLIYIMVLHKFHVRKTLPAHAESNRHLVAIPHSDRGFQEWAVAQGNLGTFFTFILLAEELLTTFTLLRHTGLAYVKAEQFYIR